MCPMPCLRLLGDVDLDDEDEPAGNGKGCCRGSGAGTAGAWDDVSVELGGRFGGRDGECAGLGRASLSDGEDVYGVG